MSEQDTDFEDARWRRLVEADAAEEPLSETDREFLGSYEPKGAEALAEREVLRAMVRLGSDEAADEEAANSPLVSATVQRYLDESAREQAGSGARWPLAVVAALAAGLAIWWFGVRPGSEPSQPPTQESVAAADAPAEPTPPRKPEPEPATPIDEAKPETLRVASGRFVQRERTLQTGDAVEAGTLSTEERSCFALADASACFDAGAQVEVKAGDAPGFEIVEGEAEIVSTKPAATTMFVQVAGDRYEVAAPVTLVISVSRKSQVRVEVTHGRATVVDADGRSVDLVAPAVRGGEKHAARHEPTPDAKTLLATARSSRARGDVAAAIDAYVDLVEHYPREPAAAPALVTLGDLHLERGKASKALRWYDRYLRGGGGTLAEEAHYGRIRALRALGRSGEAERATDAFLGRYPSSSYAGKLK